MEHPDIKHLFMTIQGNIESHGSTYEDDYDLQPLFFVIIYWNLGMCFKMMRITRPNVNLTQMGASTEQDIHMHSPSISQNQKTNTLDIYGSVLDKHHSFMLHFDCLFFCIISFSLFTYLRHASPEYQQQ